LVCAAGNSTQPRLGFFKHELMLVRLEVEMDIIIQREG